MNEQTNITSNSAKAHPLKQIYPIGDSAWGLSFGAEVAANVNVLALQARINRLRHRGLLPAIIECQPAIAELCVHYDPYHPEAELLPDALKRLCLGLQSIKPQERQLQLPICFAPDYAPDLAELATRLQLSREQIIELVIERSYKVYMLGFLPGFAYMGELPKKLQLARRATPRLQIPAGSLAIAENMAAIYPSSSPGGWHLIGRCPQPMFNPQRPEQPCLLQPGDQIRFQAIDATEYPRIRQTEPVIDQPAD